MTRLRDEHGTSLVEVAVASLLVIVVLLPVLRFFDSSVTGAAALQQSTQLHADGRLVVDQLTRELRQAYTGQDTLAPVTVAPDGLSLTVYSPDTDSPYRLRRIEYALTAGSLQRRVTSSNETSCPETMSACATFGPPWHFGTAGPWVDVLAVRQRASFAAASTNGAVRRVDISLTGTNVPGRGDRAYQTSVELRNV